MQIIVSCSGNIGRCAIYWAIVTIDMQSYLKHKNSNKTVKKLENSTRYKF